MKKTALLLILAVMTPCLFAQSSVNVAAIERAAKTARGQQVSQINTLTENVLSALKSFRRQVASYNYYDYDFMFQSMDGLRVEYMILRAKSVEAAQKIAPQIDEPISIANGKNTIRLSAYINMESCTLWETEQVKFEAFGKALREDLRQNKKSAQSQVKEIQQNTVFPEDFQYALDSYRKYVRESQTLKADWILQSMMPVMDSFNRNMKKDPSLGKAMAEALEEPIKSGWGATVVTSAFLADHSCEVWPIEDQLESFRRNLLKLAH